MWMLTFNVVLGYQGLLVPRFLVNFFLGFFFNGLMDLVRAPACKLVCHTLTENKWTMTMLYCILFVLYFSLVDVRGVESTKGVNLFPTTLLITTDASKLKSQPLLKTSSYSSHQHAEKCYESTTRLAFDCQSNSATPFSRSLNLETHR